ncbi:MAG: hypothetical protein H6689_00155 [Erysipelotrichaceae bacterium]|nr:hypothetical protein [Erysipelotrichaceae bacterium]MCB9499804.1 hypothetical protein [Erysipelotrichaceae bacterium]
MSKEQQQVKDIIDESKMLGDEASVEYFNETKKDRIKRQTGYIDYIEKVRNSVH